MNPEQIKNLLKQFDTTNDQKREEIWSKLRTLGEDVIPYFLDVLTQTTKWQARSDIVFHSIKYAQNNPEAFKIGLIAINDKSLRVKYRACQLLAYSQNPDALKTLRPFVASAENNKIKADIKAAIDAIESKNHNYFFDRNHSGKVFWEVKNG
ncbi:MAG TPA: HEAT repeat domain-containing protein [Candidatus Binatia bacterium]|nr:HEAT repeat domain-containing protein [Candidatus Binatia bacterium]